jgi:hypothetical protein
MKGQASVGSIIIFIFVGIIFIIGIAPVMQSQIAATTGIDTFTAFILSLFVVAILVLFAIGVFVHVFGQPQLGVQK